jgi:hypothetical protein
MCERFGSPGERVDSQSQTGIEPAINQAVTSHPTENCDIRETCVAANALHQCVFDCRDTSRADPDLQMILQSWARLDVRVRDAISVLVTQP